MNKKLKILNLYCGIGGNRKKWEGHEIIAVENNEQYAQIYKDFFPSDEVVIGDAHEYLLNHYKEFDFIWSSPPCPSHSHIRKELSVEARGQNKAIYPDMKLYEEILFLEGYFKGKWVVENVVSWYSPLKKPFESGHHYYWSNFIITKMKETIRNHHASIEELQRFKEFDLTKYKGIDKRRILRNCVEPKAGLYVFNCAFKEKQQTLK